MKVNSSILLLIALLEGFSVMVVELAVAKMLAPIYGDSLYIWATVIGVTFTSLSIGYFFGGYLADRFHTPRPLMWILLMAALLIGLTPLVSQSVLNHFSADNIIAKILLTSLLCLLPPLAMIGMVPSILIKRLSSEATDAGKKAGSVYAISTVGGIAAAFLMGFWIIPSFGLSKPMLLVATLLGVIPMIYLLRDKKWFSFLFPVLLIFLFASQRSGQITGNASVKVHHFSEGLMGQLLVCDYNLQQPGMDTKKVSTRMLIVNRMPQTITSDEDEFLYASYGNYLAAAASVHPPQSDALLLGLGGGIIVEKLHQAQFHVDVCELDKRISQAAQQYFLTPEINKATNFIIDDARHYIKSTPKQYDVVIYDVFKGEIPPHQVFTQESFTDVKRILKPGGTIIINFLKSPNWKIPSPANNAIIKTLQSLGYYLTVVDIPHTANLLIVAQLVPIDFSNLSLNALNKIEGHDLNRHLFDPGRMNLKNTEVLTDNRPILEILTMASSKNARDWYTENYTMPFLKYDIPIFK